MPERLKELFTIVFLGDQQPPTKLVMLKRTSGRYGGGLYTGIGGHFEPGKDRTMLASAERELGEEVPGLAGTPIAEFARCIVNGKKGLYYFSGYIDSTKPLPEPDEQEGEISWILVNDLFKLNTFPSTRLVLEEWARRQFGVGRPWTLYLLGKEDKEGITRELVIEKLEDLCEN